MPVELTIESQSERAVFARKPAKKNLDLKSMSGTQRTVGNLWPVYHQKKLKTVFMKPRS